MNPFRKLHRFRNMVLPLALVAVLVGYSALSYWMAKTPAKCTASLLDLSGDPAALTDFPVSLSLRSQFTRQNLQIKNGDVQSDMQYRYQNDTHVYPTPALFEDASLLALTPESHTTQTEGFLPGTEFYDDNIHGMISSTDRAEIYLDATLTTDELNGAVCLPTGLFLQSSEQDIAIGSYQTTETVSPPTMSAPAVTKKVSYLLGAFVGPYRFDEDMSTGYFNTNAQNAPCGDNVFVMPQPEAMLDNMSARGTITVTGTRSLYRITKASRTVSDPSRGSTPNKIRTCGNAEAVLSFPAEDSALLTLQAIQDRYVFLGMQVKNQLVFYLLNPDGSLVDQLSLPLDEQDFTDSLSWGIEAAYQNQDDDALCLSLLVNAAHNEYDPVENTSTSEILYSKLLTFRIHGDMQCVAQLNGSILDSTPALMAWRNGQLLVIEVSNQQFDPALSIPDGQTRSYYPYNCHLYLTVYRDAAPVYRGELQTDINDNYFKVSYVRRYANICLADDPISQQEADYRADTYY